MTKRFSIIDAFKFGFNTFFNNIQLFIIALLYSVAAALGLCLLLFILLWLLGYFSSFKEMYNMMPAMTMPMAEMQKFALGNQMVGPPLLIILLGFLLNGLLGRFLWLGFTIISLDLYDTQTSNVRRLFSGLPFLLRDIVALALYGLIVSVGLVLLLVPGFILAIKYGFFRYLIVDKNISVKQAFTKSASITAGAKWQLFALWLITSIFNQLGTLFFGIGLLITMPITLLIDTYVYRKLLVQTEQQEAPIPHFAP